MILTSSIDLQRGASQGTVQEVTGNAFPWVSSQEKQTFFLGGIQLTRELGINVALTLMGMYREHVC